MESNQMNFAIVWRNNGEDGHKGIIGGIGFHNELSVGDPVYKDQSYCESFLECIESHSTIPREIPLDVFLSQSHEQDCDIIVVDELSVEIGKSKGKTGCLWGLGQPCLVWTLSETMERPSRDRM
jgi:hypothetical protein